MKNIGRLTAGIMAVLLINKSSFQQSLFGQFYAAPYEQEFVGLNETSRINIKYELFNNRYQ